MTIRVHCPNCGCDYETAKELRAWKDNPDGPEAPAHTCVHHGSGKWLAFAASGLLLSVIASGVGDHTIAKLAMCGVGFSVARFRQRRSKGGP